MGQVVRRRGWAWLGLAIVVSFVARLPFLGLPMISDEGGYAYVARRWFNDTGHLYHDIWVSRPQGILFVYGMVDWVGGASVVSFRFAAWLACVATMIAVWRYARAWAGREIAIVSAIAFAVIASAPSLEGFTANAEVFMALPSALLATILLNQTRRGCRPRSLVLIGVLAGIATLLKPSGIVMLGVAIAFLWLEGRGTVRLAAKRSGYLLCGFVSALVPALIHGWIVGWDAFVFASVAYRLANQSSLTSSPLHHVVRLASLFRHSWWLLTAVLIPLLGRQRAIHGRMLAGLPAAVSRLANDLLRPSSLALRMRIGGIDPGGTLLRLWLLGCSAGIAMGGDWWSHYLLQAAAPIAIGLAVLTRDALLVLPSVRRLGVATAISLLLLVPYSIAGYTAPDDRSERIFHNTAYPNESAIASYVTATSNPEDRIYVAFNDAAIYYLADRPGSFPYLFNQELLAFANAETGLIAMLSGPNRPAIIIDSGMPAPFADEGAAFWTAVHETYEVEATVGGATVYRSLSRGKHPGRLSPEV